MSDENPMNSGADIPSAQRSLRIAMVYGEFSSAIHGPFDLEGLYTRQGLTGSESSFFNLARTLSERGHEVAVFCVCEKPATLKEGVEVLPIRAVQALPQAVGIDAVIAWNEPDYLRFAPAGAVRLVDQQLNDWGYCRTDWQSLVDKIVFPSASSRRHHLEDEKIEKARVAEVIPNSVDLDLFTPNRVRDPHRAVYCSSPDRGLHHLLSFWPEIRRRLPDATLKIFYRLAPWLAQARDLADEIGRRARFIENALERLVGSRFGVELVDLVPNTVMARELQAATALVYPCDPVRYTEGFGCSVLDACAAGCLPIISDADALPEVHGAAAAVIAGKPAEQRQAWIDHVSWLLSGAGTGDGGIERARRAMVDHAAAHSRQRIAEQWEQLLYNMTGRAQPTTTPAPQRAPFEVARVREKHGFKFAEVRGTPADHASWWSFDDEQVVRDRWWHPKLGDVVFDVGAAFGSYTLPALRDGARVVCFSPAQFDTDLLTLNLSLNPELAKRCLVLRDGVYSRSGLFCPDHSHFEEGKPAHARCAKSKNDADVCGWLLVDSIDSVVRHHGFDRLDWIKMDIEGAEHEALRGSEQTLRRFKPRLLIECHNFHDATMERRVVEYVMGLGIGYRCEGPVQHGSVSHVYFEVK